MVTSSGMPVLLVGLLRFCGMEGNGMDGEVDFEERLFHFYLGVDARWCMRKAR